jgi:hypothetical protein
MDCDSSDGYRGNSIHNRRQAKATEDPRSRLRPKQSIAFDELHLNPDQWRTAWNDDGKCFEDLFFDVLVLEFDIQVKNSTHQVRISFEIDLDLSQDLLSI